MKRRILSLLRAVDRRLAATSLRRRRERPALIAFAVHTLFADEREAASGTVDPFHPVLVRDLERFVENFLGLGYRFVAPADIIAGLDPAGHYAWLTFDDGYANNLRALPLLGRYGVPATFFVASANIVAGKAFWWDVVYRERRRGGATLAAIRREQAALKRRPPREIEARVRAEFGHSALDPVGESDRPMTAAELKTLASAPLATLGNHTADHALLTLCDDATARAQIRSCGDYLGAIAGSAPRAIAYPDGCCDARVVRLAGSEGLGVGAGVERGKNRLPLGGEAIMRLARYSLSSGTELAEQCLLSRSDVGLIPALRRLSAQRA